MNGVSGKCGTIGLTSNRLLATQPQWNFSFTLESLLLLADENMPSKAL